jgi:hypothetical protein
VVTCRAADTDGVTPVPRLLAFPRFLDIAEPDQPPERH